MLYTWNLQNIVNQVYPSLKEIYASGSPCIFPISLQEKKHKQYCYLINH